MYELFVKRTDVQEQYQCIFLDCSHAPFPRFDNARAHVRSCHFQHNGYTCTWCVAFSSSMSRSSWNRQWEGIQERSGSSSACEERE
ncbi:hypothetical protein JB92DRAFT_2935207 [Gautieria morchelliformis]|nr:hypothetical protein JB92DRAFT_2935207 [Gautieria morchelliformis]